MELEFFKQLFKNFPDIYSNTKYSNEMECERQAEERENPLQYPKCGGNLFSLNIIICS